MVTSEECNGFSPLTTTAPLPTPTPFRPAESSISKVHAVRVSIDWWRGGLPLPRDGAHKLLTLQVPLPSCARVLPKDILALFAAANPRAETPGLAKTDAQTLITSNAGVNQCR